MLENICSVLKYSLNLVTICMLCPYNLVILNDNVCCTRSSGFQINGGLNTVSFLPSQCGS